MFCADFPLIHFHQTSVDAEGAGWFHHILQSGGVGVVGLGCDRVQSASVNDQRGCLQMIQTDDRDICVRIQFQQLCFDRVGLTEHQSVALFQHNSRCDQLRWDGMSVGSAAGSVGRGVIKNQFISAVGNQLGRSPERGQSQSLSGTQIDADCELNAIPVDPRRDSQVAAAAEDGGNAEFPSGDHTVNIHTATGRDRH